MVILMTIYCTAMFVLVYCRSLAVGTKTGYKLFSLTTVEKLDCIHESGQYGVLNRPRLPTNYISIKQQCYFSVTNWTNVSGLHVLLVQLGLRSFQSCDLLNHLVHAEVNRLLCMPGLCVMPHHPCLDFHAESGRDCKTLLNHRENLVILHFYNSLRFSSSIPLHDPNGTLITEQCSIFIPQLLKVNY